MTNNLPPNIILFGGKGGVGKTTCASAAGIQLSQRGLRTLIVSTDPAHSTSDIFNHNIKTRPTEIDTDLYAAEIVPEEWFKQQYSEKLATLLDRAKQLGFDIESDDITDVTAEGLIPGADELAVIDVFAAFASDHQWDVVVFDTAPTGHTLRLLQLPDVAGAALSKIVKLKSGVNRVTAAASRVFGGGSQRNDVDLKSNVSTARTRLETVSNLLEDPDRTEFNIVTNAEQMALNETKRLYKKLHETEIRVGQVIANQVRLDVNECCDYCTSQQQRQMMLLDEFESELDIKTCRVPSLPQQDDRARVELIAERIPINLDTGR